MTDVQDQALRAILRYRGEIERRYRYLLGLERRYRAARGRRARGVARNELWAAIHKLDEIAAHELLRHAIGEAVKVEAVNAVIDEATAAVHDHLNRSQRQ